MGMDQAVDVLCVGVRAIHKATVSALFDLVEKDQFALGV